MSLCRFCAEGQRRGWGRCSVGCRDLQRGQWWHPPCPLSSELFPQSRLEAALLLRHPLALGEEQGRVRMDPQCSGMAVRSCVLSLVVPQLFPLSWGCCGAELVRGGVDWGGLGLHPAPLLLAVPPLFQELRLFCFYKVTVSWQPGSPCWHHTPTWGICAPAASWWETGVEMPP